MHLVFLCDDYGYSRFFRVWPPAVFGRDNPKEANSNSNFHLVRSVEDVRSEPGELHSLPQQIM
jgi:hypothetical protein